MPSPGAEATLAQPLQLRVYPVPTLASWHPEPPNSFSGSHSFFKKLILLQDNYFTTLWWFLPYIDINQPHVHMCPPTLSPLPLPSLPHPSGLSQSTSFECPASCIKLGLVIYFTYGNILVSVLFSQIMPPLLLPQNPKICSLHLCLFCFLAHRNVITVFLNSVYMS